MTEKKKDSLLVLLELEREFKCLKEWSVCLAYRGSVAHNMYVPSTDPDSIDDKDLMSICVPPLT